MTWHRGRLQLFLELVPPLGYTQVANVKLYWKEKVGDIIVIKKVDSLRIVGWRLLLKQNGFHLMMIHLLRSLEEGDSIPISI